MLQFLWDPRGYFFWLLVVSAVVLGLERARPWRREQRLLRRQFGQDVFWLVFNGHYAGILVTALGAFAFAWARPAIATLAGWRLLAAQPLWVQFAVFFVLKDLLDWGIHNLLHRWAWLWEFHKLHHSIVELDWIGNFRFHWMEVVLYQGLTYLPLLVLGVDGRIVLWIAILTTLIGHLNHSNLNLTWGPARYLLNSPRMHVWHHASQWPAGRRYGVNFGISLSVWDWIFGTAWWPAPADSPRQQPQRLGFQGIEAFPSALVPRLLHPLASRWRTSPPAR